MPAIARVNAAMPQFDLDLLRTFVAIADAGSLTRAAAEVARTQSAVSMQVQRLEEIAEGAVLVRTPRGVQLTARGQRLLAHARRLLRAHDEAVRDVTGRGLAGAIRLGCPEDYCIAFLPPLLRAVAAAYPRVTLELACAPTPALRRELAARRLDLALVSLAADAPREDATPVLRREPLVWVAAAGGVLPRGADDEALQVALSAPDTLDHLAARRALADAGWRYRVAYESTSKDGLLAIVRAGIAVAVLTRAAVPPDLRELDAASGLPPLPAVGIAVASADAEADSLLVAEVKALMARTLQALPDGEALG